MRKKLCPKCGSGKIVPTSDGYSCQDCGNAARESELLEYAPKASALTDVSGAPMTTQELAVEMGKDFLQRLYSGAAKPIGKAIVDAGFASRNDTEAITRLIRAGCMGAFNSTLEEVEVIAKERQKDAS